MLTDIQYAYLVWCGLFALVWVGLYAARRDARREMLIMSVIGAILGPLAQIFYIRDYFAPTTITGTPIGIEDALIGFLIGGISAALYELWLWDRVERPAKAGVLSLVVVALVLSTAWMFIAVFYLGIPSVYASTIFLMVIGVSMITYRPRLAKNAVYSGVLLTVFFFLFYQLYFWLYPDIVDAWWYLSNVSGIIFINVPLEEYLWAFSWGFVAGPASELVARMRFLR